MVVLGRPPGYRGSYKQWVEDNVAPQVVFEICVHPVTKPRRWSASSGSTKSTGLRSTTCTTPRAETWRAGGALQGELEEIPEMAGLVGARSYEIRFEPGEGPDNLKILDPQGVPFARYVELIEQREAKRDSAR